MGELRWYKRDPHAALDGMMELSLEERGAYNTVLDLIYARDGAVDDDERFIAGWLRVDVRVWRRLRARLIDLEKLYVADGQIRNARADVEVDRGLHRLASARHAGVISGRIRGASDSENKDLSGTPVERTFEPSRVRIRKKDSDPNGSAPGGAREKTLFPEPAKEAVYSDSRHALWGEGVPILVSLGMTDKRARSMLGFWLKGAGDDAAKVLAVIHRARDHKPMEPIEWITRAMQTEGGNGRTHHNGADRGGRHGPRPNVQDTFVAGMAAALSERPNSRLARSRSERRGASEDAVAEDNPRLGFVGGGAPGGRAAHRGAGKGEGGDR